MTVGMSCGNASTWCALEESVLDQEWFIHLFDGPGVFPEGRGNGAESNGAPVEFLDDGAEQSAVHVVQPEVIDIEQRESRLCYDAVYGAICTYLGVIAYTAQKTVGNPGCSAASTSHFPGSPFVDFDLQHFGCATHYDFELFGRVEVELVHKPESRSKRRGEHSEARGGPYQGEPFDVHRNGLCLRAFGQADVDSEILHRRIEKFFDYRPQSVDFVDEKDVAFTQVGKGADEVAWFFQRGAGSSADVDAQLTCDEVGQGCFAKARWAEKECVVEWLPASPGCFQRDREAFFDLLLAYEFG